MRKTGTQVDGPVCINIWILRILVHSYMGIEVH